MKRLISVILLLAIMLTAPAPVFAADAVQEIILAGYTTVPVGGTVTWRASVYPQDAANQTIIWKSWYPAVASVSADGTIIGHKAGKAHISAIAANGVKKTCSIFVTDPYSAYSGASSSYDYEDEPAETYSYGVYVTRTGSKYHRSSCRYLRKSKIAISLSSARAYGYTACSVCRP